MANSKYDDVLNDVFRASYRAGARRLSFLERDLRASAQKLGHKVGNFWDLIYTYGRGRKELPGEIRATGNWHIEILGRGQYAFAAIKGSPYVEVPHDLAPISIPDATPEVVYKYCGTDEQALLAKIRYCRLIDTMTGLAAWHLQGHFKATLQGGVQVEVDEFYLGVDRNGQWYTIPVEAKARGERNRIAKGQIAAMVQFSKERFPRLGRRPIAAKEVSEKALVLVELTAARRAAAIKIKDCKHYALARGDGQRR